MDLVDAGRALRRFWLPSLAVFVITVAVGFVVGSGGATRYESTAVISLSPNTNVSGSGEAVRYQLPVVVERVGSQTFRAELAETLPADTMNELDTLVAVNDDNTGIVRITAKGTGRDEVAEVADAAAMALLLPDPAAGEPANAVIVEVIDDAGPGQETGKDNLVGIVLASVVLGAILALGVAVALQAATKALDPAMRVQRTVGVPVLAVLPRLAELKGHEADLAQLVLSGPGRVVGAFQALRSQVAADLDQPGSVLAVTSWQRGEGSTTVAAALGLTVAGTGRDVVVVDADLEGPDLADRLGVASGPGLGGLDRVGADQLVVATGRSHLGVVAAGVSETHPAQTLAVALPAALAAIAARDPRPVTVIDAPTLGAGRVHGDWVQLPAEAATVLTTAQRVLLVIDVGVAPLQALGAAVARLREDKVDVVGAVVNRRRRGLLRHR